MVKTDRLGLGDRKEKELSNRPWALGLSQPTPDKAPAGGMSKDPNFHVHLKDDGWEVWCINANCSGPNKRDFFTKEVIA
jgi:hypothetical protein